MCRPDIGKLYVNLDNGHDGDESLAGTAKIGFKDLEGCSSLVGLNNLARTVVTTDFRLVRIRVTRITISFCGREILADNGSCGTFYQPKQISWCEKWARQKHLILLSNVARRQNTKIVLASRTVLP